VAQLAEEYAMHTRQDPDALFLAGLLHDIGKTVMVDFLERPVDDCEEECKQLGIDHAEVAALIMKRWQFPPEIIHMVRYHHEPDNDLGTLSIYCANMISHFAQNEELLRQMIDKTVEKLPAENKEELKENLFNIVIQSNTEEEI
jgi:putative nucleotidyltransferase with HDIG domain